MAMITKIVGVENVLKNLSASELLVGKGIETGIKRAALFLQRKSMKVVPIDTGVLKGSAYSRHVGKGIKTIGLVGYTTEYGVYVHENLNARHAEGKQAKFLEGPAKEFRKEILKIIQDGASKVK